MTLFAKLAAGAALALGLGLASTGAADAQSWHSDCDAAGCLRTNCDDAGVCTTSSDFAQRRLRYACDAYGENCLYTRDYFVNQDGKAEYDGDADDYP